MGCVNCSACGPGELGAEDGAGVGCIIFETRDLIFCKSVYKENGGLQSQANTNVDKSQTVVNPSLCGRGAGRHEGPNPVTHGSELRRVLSSCLTPTTQASFTS
jgi:hypothetical protein